MGFHRISSFGLLIAGFCRLQTVNAKYRKVIGRDAQAETMEREVKAVSLFVEIHFGSCRAILKLAFFQGEGTRIG